MELREIRQKIDRVDDEITRLFQQRMGLVADVAQEKRTSGAPVLSRAREEAILERLAWQVKPEYRAALRQLYVTIMHISREYQAKMLENKEYEEK